MHFVIIGGDGVQLLGGYIPPSPPPPVSAPLDSSLNRTDSAPKCSQLWDPIIPKLLVPLTPDLPAFPPPRIYFITK